VTKPETSPIWMELTVDRSGEEIRVGARSSRDEWLEPRPLGAGHNATSLLTFAAAATMLAVCLAGARG
jgi:hypothetical protein